MASYRSKPQTGDRTPGPWRHLVDEMVAAYAEWREECANVRAAYDRWSCADAADEPLAFGAYQSALDKEEKASQEYAALVASVGERVRF
jgi:hypothetical protein